MAWTARMTACIPEAHIIFTVYAGVETGTPTAIPIWRAIFIPRPALRTLPTTTVSTHAGSSQVNAAFPAAIPKSVAEYLARAPRKRPCTVRLAATIQMDLLLGICLRLQVRDVKTQIPSRYSHSYAS